MAARRAPPLPPVRLPQKPRLIVDLEPMRARTMAAWQTGAARPGAAGFPWLERAHRLAPSDQNLRFALAMRRLETGDHQGAADLLGDMARRFGVPECWAGLIAAHLAMGASDAARAALHIALSTCEADPALADLAHLADGQTARAAERAGAPPGWCGLRLDGTLLASAPAHDLAVLLDGAPIRAARRDDGTFGLPPGWRHAETLEVRTPAGPLLGSPIALPAIRRLEGCVTRTGDTVTGTAWHPAAPGHTPATTWYGSPRTPTARSSVRAWKRRGLASRIP